MRRWALGIGIGLWSLGIQAMVFECVFYTKKGTKENHNWKNESDFSRYRTEWVDGTKE